jgi:hypothetical protein
VLACVLAAAGIALEVLHVPGRASGAVAWGAFVITVVAADSIYQYCWRLARAVTLALAFISACLVVILLPDTMGALHPSDARIGLVVVLRLALVAGSGYIFLKLLLLHRYASLPQEQSANSPSDCLLPFQANALNRLEEVILAQADAAEARIVQFEGEWGEGKTRVLWALRETLRQRLTVVEVDVWKCETERALDVAVVEKLLSAPEFMHPFGWLGYPLTLLSSAIRELGVRLTAKFGGYGDVTFQLPHLAYQRVLERLVEVQWSRHHRRTVIVLDEIDRAAPPVVQAALTVTRRSLDLPGLCVVLAYVPGVMAYKAFNPLAAQLSDLASSTWAELLRVFDDQDEAWLKDAVGAQFRSAATGAGELVTPRWRPRSHDESLLERALALQFSRQEPEMRRRLQLRVGEKYLNTTPVTMSTPSEIDLAQMTVKFSVIRSLIERLLLHPLSAPLGGLSEGAAKLMDKIWHEMSTTRRRYPPLRTLSGYIVAHLDNELSVRLSDNTACTSAELLFIILAAVERADQALRTT